MTSQRLRNGMFARNKTTMELRVNERVICVAA